MIKRILAGAAAAGFAASLLVSGTAGAIDCAPNTAPAAPTGAKSQGLPDGGTVGYTTPSAAGGYISIQGSHGYLEAKGGPGGGGNGSIQGHSNDAPLEGRIGDGAHLVCVNGTAAP